jgi:opacity protein-like surface antigen
MKKILLTTTMLVGLSAVANAATEAGKMYVGADVGYQFSGSKNEALGSSKSGNRLTGFVGDIRFGYAIADNIRTDLSISFSNPSGDQKVAAITTPGANDGINFVSGDAVKKETTALATANTAFTTAAAGQTNTGAATVTGTAITAASGAPGIPPALTAAIFTGSNIASQNLAVANAGTTFDRTKETTAKMKNRNIGLMANVYYDFNTGSAFTPYIMGGVGLSRSNQQLTISGTSLAPSITGNTPTTSATGFTTATAGTTSITLKSANKTGFAYAIGAGVGYEMSKDVVLDVGYKLTGRPSSTYTHKLDKDGDSLTIGGKTYNKANPYTSKAPSVAHSFTAGVRFAF